MVKKRETNEMTWFLVREEATNRQRIKRGNEEIEMKQERPGASRGEGKVKIKSFT